MRAIVQRVSKASVEVDRVVCGTINDGLLVYLGVDRDDGNEDVTYLADKVRHLRVFPDKADRMNLDLEQAGGKVLDQRVHGAGRCTSRSPAGVRVRCTAGPRDRSLRTILRYAFAQRRSRRARLVRGLHERQIHQRRTRMHPP